MEKNLLLIAQLTRDMFQRDWIISFPNVIASTCREALPRLESPEM